MNVQDAVSEGLFQFLTQATVSLLGTAVGIEVGGGSGNGSGDPFDNDPPIQP